VNSGEKVPCGLVVAGGDGAELLELGEEVLDEVARLVEFSVEGAGQAAVRLWRDHRGLSDSGKRGDDPGVGVEGFVGDQRLCLHRWQQVIGANEIVRLPAGQEEAYGIAESIDQGMDLGGQRNHAAARGRVGR
jgi:hypothetical protein